MKIPRALGVALAALLLSAGGLAGGIALAAPASAHDELLSTDPANGATLTAAPESLTLTFSANINPEPSATEVQMTDAAGTALAGEPTVQDNVLTVPVEREASGAVTVLWKVVSSDGHPISGEFAFTVDAPAPAPSATPSETASAEPSETAEPSATPEPSETAVTPPTDADSTFGEVWPWIVGLVLFAAVGGAVLYLLVSRSRREQALAKNSER